MREETQGGVIVDWIQVAACPLCGSSGSSHSSFSTLRAGSQMLSYRLCSVCGLVFQSPRPEDNALADYYQHRYHLREHSEEQEVEKDSWVQRQRAEHMLRKIGRDGMAVARHLDLGCSSGELLETVQTSVQSDGWGVEPSEIERARAAERGFSVVPTLADLPDHLEASFDLITMAHVLEHLPEPLETLRELRQRWLKPEGCLVIEVPNLYSHLAFELGHLTAFTARSLQQMLGRAGFRVASFHLHGRPYSRLLPLFIMAVASPFPDRAWEGFRAPPVTWIRFRRWLGLSITRLARALGSKLLSRKALRPWN